MKKQSKANYKIRRADGTIVNAGRSLEGLSSWFTLEEARNTVNYDKGEMIHEYNGGTRLWEVL